MQGIMAVLYFGLIASCFVGGIAMAAEGKLIITIIPEVDFAGQMERYAQMVNYRGRHIGIEEGTRPLANQWFDLRRVHSGQGGEGRSEDISH